LSPELTKELRVFSTTLAKYYGEYQLLLQQYLENHPDQTPRGHLQHHLPGRSPGTATTGGPHTPLHLLPLLLEPARQEQQTTRAKQEEEEEEKEER
jgi:hypothetical protein